MQEQQAVSEAVAPQPRPVLPPAGPPVTVAYVATPHAFTVPQITDGTVVTCHRAQ